MLSLPHRIGQEELQTWAPIRAGEMQRSGRLLSDSKANAMTESEAELLNRVQVLHGLMGQLQT